ncbi:sensor histidine kinase [Nocardioides pantholopis]|uniref:sensor histidine kinase n=1 Tax=Nocardioides pantholopis TaxID=2483798 RepID=UPI000FD807BB|nr:ATP-binding protein [Nocardioides pantholopis]
MSHAAPLAVQRRRFARAVPCSALLCLAFAVLLSPLVPASVREPASGLGLITSAAVGITACLVRVRQTRGRRRRTWVLVAAAGLAGIASNLWVAGMGADPVDSPSGVGDGIICLALLLSTAALLTFPTIRRRGIDRTLLILDGAVIAAAVVVTTSILVYQRVLESDSAHRTALTTQLIPVFDVVLVTVALLLIVRSTGADRPALALISAGFVMYTVADLAFAVLVATREFQFGTLVDLGWMAGYLLIGLAAWYPSAHEEGPSPAPASLSDARATAVVYAVVLVAGAVQVLAPVAGRFGTAQGLLWLVIVAAVGARQTLLTLDHSRLRRGLEEQVRAQTADLRRMARQTDLLVSSVGDGIYGVDGAGRVTFVNPSAARALGCAREDLLGQDAHERFHAPRHDGTPYPWAGCYVAEAIRDGHSALAEQDVYVRADGERFPVEITASPIHEDGASGPASGAVVVFRDMTQRREIDRMKNEFVSVVSHELRTPLTSIRGSLGLLAGGALGALGPRAQGIAETALESSERLTRLINDILDLDRIQSGSGDLELGTHDVADLIARSTGEMGAMADAVDVTLVNGPAGGRVFVDADRIVQTLTNLLGNAIKFSDPGSEVVVSATPGENEVVFSVLDHGRGIPADKLDAVFERFQQVDSSDARQKGGTGLGLAISRGIVERHGGRIWAESGPGLGTTVSFSIPRASRTHRPAPRAAVAVVGGTDRTAATWTEQLTGHGFDLVHVGRAGFADAGDPGARPPALTLLALPLGDGVDPLSLCTSLQVALGAPPSDAEVLLIETDHQLRRALTEALTGHCARVTAVDPDQDAPSGAPEHEAGPRVLLVDLDARDAVATLARLRDRPAQRAALVAVHRTEVAPGSATQALAHDILAVATGVMARQNGEPW